MIFGRQQPDAAPRRGLSPSVRRQLIILVAMLLGTLLIGLQFLQTRYRAPERATEEGSGGVRGFGKPIASPAPGNVESSLGKPIEPVPPEPYVESAEILLRGDQADRTDTFDEVLIAHLLQKVRTQGDAINKETPVLSHVRKDDVFGRLLAEPARYRGQLVEIQGEILSPEAGMPPIFLQGIAYPNPSGLDRAFQSYLLGMDGKYYVVATARKQRDLAHRDSVRLRGYFCQLYSYSVEVREQMTRATIPFIVGDDYEFLERPRVGVPWSGNYLPLLVAVGIFGFVFVMVTQWRSQRSFETRRQAALARFREASRSHAASGGAPAAASPEGAAPSAGETRRPGDVPPGEGTEAGGGGAPSSVPPSPVG